MEEQTWACPNPDHPNWGEAGNCPECGKKLVPLLTAKERAASPTRFFKPTGLDAKKLGEEILAENAIITNEENDEIFYYNPEVGHYQRGFNFVKKQTQEKLGERVKRAYIDEAVAFVRNATRQKLPETPKHLVCLKNGVLDRTTKQLLPHSPEHFFLCRINGEYRPEADCPNISQFLAQVLRPEDIPVFWEIAGYCLTIVRFIQKAALFAGEGGNGKSTALNILQALLGEEAVANLSLQTICNNRFAVGQLQGKLVDIYDDLPPTKLFNTGQFKVLTGGGKAGAEKKFGGFYSFNNTAFFIFAANKVPESADETDAFFRRWVILIFPNKFEGEKADKNLLKKLTTDEELSGFLNHALEGLDRLMQQGDFTNAKSVEELREQYIKKSNPVSAFVLDCLEEDSEAFVSKVELYAAFVEYCNKNALPTTPNNVFGRKLAEVAPFLKPTQRTIDGKRTHCWQGGKLPALPAQDTLDDAYLSSCEKHYTEEYNKNANASRASLASYCESEKTVISPVRGLLQGAIYENCQEFDLAEKAIIIRKVAEVGYSEAEVEAELAAMLKEGVCSEPKAGFLKMKLEAGCL